MKNYIYILLLCTTITNAQILRFSTFYASFSTSAPFAENQEFLVDGVAGSGQLVEITQVSEPNYNVSIGLRKIARFDYQVKRGQFYTGTEDEVSDYATISNAPGIEYSLKYSSIRNRGIKFQQHEYKVRYISNHFTMRSSFVDDGLINLKYTLGEFRIRKSLGGLDLTAGIAHRSHPVYGNSPITEWFANPSNKHWWQLAQEFGAFSNDLEQWTVNNEVVAESDREFYTYHFGDLVDQYNARELKTLGLQQEVSMVIGADYYLYSAKAWVHAWASLYPIHKGLSDYSYSYPNNQAEWDLGFVAGSKVNRHFSIFVEGRHLKYWDIKSYELKAGINYLIF
tara:strand:- start:1336 stop:2352 length:1017 start_codon:yes stop_codon:yes gene_type:complete